MGACTSKPKHRRKSASSIAEQTFSINIKSVYDFGEFCGAGRYGAVFKAVSISDPSLTYAIKKINKEFITNTENLRQEVMILSGLHHPNIIKVYETYQDRNFFYIVMQHCSGGTLFSKLSGAGKYREHQGKSIMRQLIRSVRYLHSKGICHRDLKPQNFLFSSNKENAKIKLIDFGLSHRIGKWFKGMKDLVGTLSYIAPEVISGRYDEKCDIWSLGVIMYYVLTGFLPFDEDKNEIENSILNKEISFNLRELSKVSEEAKDLLKRLLCRNTKERISINEAYDHPWFLKNLECSIEIARINSALEYCVKEETFITIANQIVHEFTYQEIKAFAKEFEGRYIEVISVNDFEEIIKHKLNVGKDSLVNTKKIFRHSLELKHHLNEERLWQEYQKYDIVKDNKISLEALTNLIECIEGNHKRSLSSLPHKSTYSYEDLMHFYDQGRLLCV